ncbi:MAG: DNA adenine methylase [Polyangiaceae bacterium]
MSVGYSPLRYPGGKQVLSRVIAHLISINHKEGGIYAEPYAGGAGAALNLLFGEHVHRLILNDADQRIYAMWWGILHATEQFVSLIHDTPLSVEEWEHQRATYQAGGRVSRLRLGFATFYLNRCNRSGIISNGGPIGGKAQDGQWKIDARFNRPELERRVRRVALYKDRISVFNLDAVCFLRKHIASLPQRERAFVYLDPPYYAKGRDLYLNYYAPEDHAALAAYIKSENSFTWILSYDNVPEVRKLYSELRQVQFGLSYSARERRSGREVLILKPDLIFPSPWRRKIDAKYITSADSAPPMPAASGF